MSESMSNEEDVFPILDRRTPVIERIREARNNDPEESLESKAEDIGEIIAGIDEVQDEETLDKVEDALKRGVKRGIVEESEYGSEEVSDDYVARIVDLMMVIELGGFEEDVDETEGEQEVEEDSDNSFNP